jgi:TRAP-type C4-dicarboxylate transport system permease large subunit
MTLLLLGGLLIFLVLGVPVSFSLLASSLLYLVFKGMPSALAVQRLAMGIDSIVLLALPFFIFAEALMNTVKSGNNCGSAITGENSFTESIIPFCVSAVVFGFICGVSIGKILIGGIIPILVILGAAGYSPVKSFLAAALIFGGITTGLLTPTETAAALVVYSLVLCAICGKFNLKNLLTALRETASSAFGLAFTISCAVLFATLLSMEGLPQGLAEFFAALTSNEAFFLFIIMILLFAVGRFMEPISVIVIFVPMLLPVALVYGIDHIHFGIVSILALLTGGLKLPAGMLRGISEKPPKQIAKIIWPYGVALITLFVVTFVPPITISLPALFP